MPNADDRDTFEITSTRDDYAALLLYTTRRPHRLAYQGAVYGFMWLSFVVMQLAIGLLGALFSAKHGLAAAARAYVTTEFRQDLATSAPIFTAFVVALFLLSIVVLIPRQCRLLATKIIDAYPAPGAAGAPLPSLLHLTERGIENVADHERVFVAWPLVRRLAETRGHLFLMTGPANGLAISKAALGAASTDRLRDLVASRLAAAAAAMTDAR